MVTKRNPGSVAPWTQWSDALTVTGKASLVAANDTYRADLLAGTTVALDLNFSTGAGAGQRALQLHCTTATFTTVNRTYGQKWVQLDVAWQADANTTDVGASGGRSPIKATLRNAVASGTYA
jgi:hypothetical protein